MVNVCICGLFFLNNIFIELWFEWANLGFVAEKELRLGRTWVEQEGVTVLVDCFEPSGCVGRDELSLEVGLAGNAEPGAMFSPGPPLQGQLGVHWELSQQILPVGISLHKEEDLVLTQPHFLCPTPALLSPAASAEPLTFPPFRADVLANEISVTN